MVAVFVVLVDLFDRFFLSIIGTIDDDVVAVVVDVVVLNIDEEFDKCDTIEFDDKLDNIDALTIPSFVFVVTFIVVDICSIFRIELASAKQTIVNKYNNVNIEPYPTAFFVIGAVAGHDTFEFMYFICSIEFDIIFFFSIINTIQTVFLFSFKSPFLFSHRKINYNLVLCLSFVIVVGCVRLS